jgi:hypothetical protein
VQQAGFLENAAEIGEQGGQRHRITGNNCL